MIIIGVPCIGKTFCAKSYPDRVHDLESSDYRWDYSKVFDDKEIRKGTIDRIEKIGWERDYIEDCLSYHQKGYIVCTGVYSELINYLDKNKIEYIAVVGSHEFTPIQVRRAAGRGNSDKWIADTILKYKGNISWAKNAKEIHTLDKVTDTLSSLLIRKGVL